MKANYSDHRKNIGKITFFFTSFLVAQISHADTKILIARHKNWSHPVEKVFRKYDISLYKIHYSKDGTCPTFYANFKHSPITKTQTVIDYSKVYTELLKANANWPFALVDKKEDVKINISWVDKQKKSTTVDVAKANSLSTCRGNSHANIDDGAEYDNFIITEKFKKQILASPYKATMRRSDGKQFIAYLYAEKTTYTGGFTSCSSANRTTYNDKTGHYYIYLYDPSIDSFFPGRIEIYNDYYNTTMNVPGADFFALSVTPNKSDILLVSQDYLCSYNRYEAYGFSENKLFLKKYTFITTKKLTRLEAKISKEKQQGKIVIESPYHMNEEIN